MNPAIQLDAQAHGWSRRRARKAARLARLAPWTKGRVLETGAIVEALQALIEPGDAVALEGDNQKQADFLSRALVQADPAQLHDLHLLISSVSRPEHLTLFERGIARTIDLAYAGPESVRLAQLLADGKLEIGAIHTYVELYARMFVDLMPDVALVCADQADRQGNLYTGPNTEDTPTIVEATAFHDGVVVMQVNDIVDELPRVDIPASWVDVIVAADRPYQMDAEGNFSTVTCGGSGGVRPGMDTPIGEKPGADLRDYLAEERTFLAWIRTGLALMGFGFVVARFGLFVEELHITQHGSVAQPHGLSPWFGTTLIAVGVAVNLFSARRYIRLVGELNRGQFVHRRPSKQAVIVALFLALVGIAMAIYLTMVRGG